MPTDSARADHEAMLIVGTFVTAQQNPLIWERFANRLFDEWHGQANADATSRSAAAEKAIAALGQLAQGRGGVADLSAAATDRNPQPAQAPNGG